MRRWTLLLAGAALWLFLAAIPALADGGPHSADINSGTLGVDADSCAGCHRAHTAQGMYLLVEEDGPAFCLTCHGETGVGATTDVETGQQYTPTGAGTDRGVALGALRSGGFIEARIASGNAYRLAYLSGGEVRQLAKVPVAGTASAVTSAHLPVVAGQVANGTGIAWGNGPDSTAAFAGATVAMSCGTCHNPHGNKQYRILNTLPAPVAQTADPFVPAAAPAPVTDAALPPDGDQRNYTVIQTNGGTGTLLASQVDALNVSDTAGDYFRRRVPWNGTATGTYANDAPNGLSASFTAEISAWCLTCHSRYISEGWDVETTDAIYKYRHTSDATSRNCITCHVSHGSNAVMDGAYSGAFPYPGGAAPASASSRLLKIDNRGTCQACHDPTETITAGTGVGPIPVPFTP